jgi:hypothetical protein
MTHLFKSISLDKLDNAVYFLFMKLIHDKAADSKMLSAKARRFVDVLGEGVKLVDESLKLSRKSGYTDDLRTLEQQRMAVLKTMKSAVNGITEFPNENKDVKAMLQLFKDYSITGKLKLDQKTSLIINLITDMEGKNAAQTKALNLGSHVERLKEVNNRYLALSEERTSESITKGVGSMRAARKSATRRIASCWRWSTRSCCSMERRSIKISSTT